jgi:hypothetical protein
MDEEIKIEAPIESEVTASEEASQVGEATGTEAEIATEPVSASEVPSEEVPAEIVDDTNGETSVEA